MRCFLRSVCLNPMLSRKTTTKPYPVNKLALVQAMTNKLGITISAKLCLSLVRSSPNENSLFTKYKKYALAIFKLHTTLALLCKIKIKHNMNKVRILTALFCLLTCHHLIQAQSCVGTTVFNVSITPLPTQPSAITGSTSPCPSTQVYSVTNTSGVTYTWSAGAGGTISGGQGTNTVTVTWSATGAQTLNVVPSNTCGNGTAQNLAVTVATTPTQPSAISGNTTVCSDTPMQGYSITEEAGITYTWSVSGGGSIVGTGRTATANWTTPGTYTLQATPSNSCGSGTPSTLSVTVTQVPTPVITGNANVCTTITEVYTVTNVPGHSYIWSVSSNGVIVSGQNTNSITVQWNNGTAGTVSVTETAQ